MSRQILLLLFLLVVFAHSSNAQIVSFQSVATHPANISAESDFLLAIEAFYPQTCGVQIGVNVSPSQIDVELDVSELVPLPVSPCLGLTEPTLSLINPRNHTEDQISFTNPLTINIFTRGIVEGQQLVATKTIEFSGETNEPKALQAGSWASDAFNGRNITIDNQGEKLVLILAQNRENGNAHEFAVGNINGDVFSGELKQLDCTPGPDCTLNQSHRVGDVNMLIKGYNYMALHARRDEDSAFLLASHEVHHYSRLRFVTSENHESVNYKDSIKLPDLSGTWAIYFSSGLGTHAEFTLEEDSRATYVVTQANIGYLSLIRPWTSFIRCFDDPLSNYYGSCIHYDVASDYDCSFDFPIADAGIERIENVVFCRNGPQDTDVGLMFRINE